MLNIDKTLGTLDNAKSLTVESENASMKLGPATLAALNAASTGKITLKSEKKEGTPLTFKSADGVYNCTINSFYTFDLLLDDVKYTQTPFPTDFEITLPFNALAASATQRSVVDVFDENGTITDTLTPTVGAGTVTFNPPHFSDYAVINEYQLTSEFVKGTAPFAGGSVKLNGVDLGSGKFIPENATVNNVTASLGNNAAGNKIKQITVDGTAIASSFTMPSHATKVRVEVEDLTYKTYWLMPDGTVKDTEAEANAYLDSHAAPAGYEYKKVSGKYQYNGEAMDPTALQSDVYRTPILVAKNYTVTFQPGNGIADIVVNFTVEDIATFAPPAVPERKGYTGAWETYDLGAIVTGGNAVVKAQYTAVTYTVTYANGTTASVAFGTSVDPKTGYTPSTGMEPDEIAVWTENGKQVVTGNFEMPASDVRITISEKPMTVTVTIRNDSDNTTTTVSGPFGSSATFEIRLAKNQELTTAPAGAKLVAFSVLADGTRVLTYAVTLDASTLSGVTVSYATKALTPVSSQLVAGKVGADGKPEVSKGVEFTGYKVPSNGDSTFANVTYAFATYKAAETAKSLLWLWILIALLIFFLIVAIFYVLYIRGKLKPNPILRFFTWIVSIFFMICLGIASIALWIVHLFGGKKHDYEAFGIAEPDAKNADKEADGEENGEEAPEEAPAEEPVEEELAEDAPVEEETEEAPAEEEAEEAPAEEDPENKKETDQPDAE